MNFFRHLRSAWAYLQYIPYVDEPEWTEEDRASYSHFMNSPTGKKLKLRMLHLLNKSAVNAIHATTNIKHTNGVAAGKAATFTWLDGHLLPEPEAAAETEPNLMEAFEKQFAA